LLELRRHHDAEHAALAGPALDLDPAAVVGHDALRDGETEAGALSRRLGREERIENPAEDLLGHARSLVLELHLDLVADGARPDGEATAPVHRLQPVRGDAEEHLAELALVDEGWRQLGRRLGDEAAACEAGLAREELDRLGHEGVEAGGRAAAAGLTHELEQSPGDPLAVELS